MKVKLIKDVIVKGKPCKAGEIVEVEGNDYYELKSSGAGVDYKESEEAKKEVKESKK